MKFPLRIFLQFLFLPGILLPVISYGQKVGLVLSGGGARGLAHIGVIRALEEKHIPIDFITGTSSGAIIGCMYALGYTPDQMDSIVHTDEFYTWANGVIDEDYSYYFRKKENNASWITLKFSIDSVIQTSLPTNIISSVPYDYALMAYTGSYIARAHYDFDSLFVPYRCVAADIESKKTIVFRSGDLGQAVRASSAYPFYFKPVIFGNKILYDGGLYNNFPSDVMLLDFQPDIIIGVNAAGTNTPMSESNIISQIRAMMTTPTNFSVICENGILIEPNTDRYGLFDFTRLDEIIHEGYQTAMNQMDRIQFNISRRSDPKEIAAKRVAFRSTSSEIIIDKLDIDGINTKQSEYIRQILKPGNSPVPLSRLKASYFQLAADQNIKSIYPELKYNPETGYFDMKLHIQREKDLITQFGGNICSRPISTAFVGAQYNVWDRKSYSFNGNFYFGKLYTSGQVKIRMDSPTRIPYFLESDVTLNQYDFFRSSNAIFTDQKPAYIIKSDYNFGMNFGLPARNKGKYVLGASYIRNVDNYYQTQDFEQKDTADKTKLYGFSSAFTFERNTLNRKLYANQGTFLQLHARYNILTENTIPGSTSDDKTITLEDRNWVQAKIVYENYFKRKGRLRLGIFTEGVYSNTPFFANYTATVLNAPAFEPIPEMQTLYLPDFHAHSFLGLGSKNVVTLVTNLELRLEGYLFQPYKELIKTADKKTEYGDPFTKRFFVGSAGAVYMSPIGPVGLFVNYYPYTKNPVSVLFHIGFFIFNPSSLD